MKYLLGSILVLTLACSPKISKEVQKDEGVGTEKPENRPDTSAVVEIITEEPDHEPVEEPKIDLILEFQKTACFGKCPVFIIRAFSDGRLIYHGKANVAKTGYYEAFLAKEERELIFQKADEIGFFKLENNYPSTGPPITDLPKTKTYLKQEGTAHRVVNNYDAPLSLQKFERFLEEFFAGINWIKVNGD